MTDREKANEYIKMSVQKYAEASSIKSLLNPEQRLTFLALTHRMYSIHYRLFLMFGDPEVEKESRVYLDKYFEMEDESIEVWNKLNGFNK